MAAANPEDQAASQSPYGAKWFATRSRGSTKGTGILSQSPYGAKWFATFHESSPLGEAYFESQSPYGAKWFATMQQLEVEEAALFVAIPLRG